MTGRPSTDPGSSHVSKDTGEEQLDDGGPGVQPASVATMLLSASFTLANDRYSKREVGSR
jgi:hypothetical protein